MAELRWAPPRREDDPEWAALLAAIEAVDVRGETYELEDLDVEWQSVWAHPEENARLVWDGEELVGLRVADRAARARGRRTRSSMWGGVRPSHRRRGIGTQLFEWAIAAGQRRSRPTLDGALPTKLETDAAEHQTELLRAGRAHGPRAGAPLPRDRPADRRAARRARPRPPASSWCRGARSSTRRARLAHVESFEDHWGSEPRTVEEWTQWYTGHRAFRPDLSVLAVEPASGEVVSLVLCAAYPQDWVTVPGRGVDQHGRHPARVARQGRGVVAHDRVAPTHRGGRRRLRAGDPRRRRREPHRRAPRLPPARLRRGRPLGDVAQPHGRRDAELSRSRACGGRCRA